MSRIPSPSPVPSIRPVVFLILLVASVVCSTAAASQDTGLSSPSRPLLIALASEQKTPDPSSVRFVLADRSPREGTADSMYVPMVGTTLYFQRDEIMNAAYIDSVRADYLSADQRAITVELTDEGGVLFERITGENVGRWLAIEVEGELVFAAPIRSAVAGGKLLLSLGPATSQLDEILDRFKKVGVPIAVPAPKPHQFTKEEERAFWEAQTERLHLALKIAEMRADFADTSLWDTMRVLGSGPYMSEGTMDVTELWVTASEVWPKGKPKMWSSQVSILSMMISQIVQAKDGSLARARELSDELFDLLENLPRGTTKIPTISHWGFLTLADAYISEGRPRDAEAIYERALAIPTVLRGLMWESLSELCRLWSSEGRRSEVVELCEAEINSEDSIRHSQMMKSTAQEILDTLDGAESNK